MLAWHFLVSEHKCTDKHLYKRAINGKEMDKESNYGFKP